MQGRRAVTEERVLSDTVVTAVDRAKRSRDRQNGHVPRQTSCVNITLHATLSRPDERRLSFLLLRRVLKWCSGAVALGAFCPALGFRVAASLPWDAAAGAVK